MNSGLPSLLDAIFGKKDLDSVSLDEMYELINEFPSFNAGHFLLSKKLKQQNDAAYEKECMRTALYFNNAFWLQTLLDEGNNIWHESKPSSLREENEEEEQFKETYTVEHVAPVLEESYKEIYTDRVYTNTEFQNLEKVQDPVSTFNELIAKYNIETVEPVSESPADLPVEQVQEYIPDSQGEKLFESVENSPVESNPETHAALLVEEVQEFPADLSFNPEEKIHESIPDSDPGQFETRVEIINEYGIFEEVVEKKSDYDLEAFDRPFEKIRPAHETIPDEIPFEKISIAHETFSFEIPSTENENIVENQIRDDSPEKQVEGDYEAFDRPPDNIEIEQEQKTEVTLPDGVISAESMAQEADDTEKPVLPSGIRENGMDGKIQHPGERLEERQKSVTWFDANKADSLVFAPYHMIDYFASQGIKLVLEDNPADNFGKQLKSFTDWLKVMKKLPSQMVSEKTDEKENDRIRHFASHSIEERDILTESMAEVLAKQGMYENAIALYQKLSLIYPPKSAYFASRIDQLKASLP